MFPASTHSGQAVLGFPDVCKTPTPVSGPVPIAYPNIGMSTGTKTATKTATKTTATKTATKTASYSKSSGDEAGTAAGVASLRNHLTVLHNQLMKAKPGDTTQWHRLLDDYVMTTSQAYVSMSGSTTSSLTSIRRR